jgi:hypothetical protein
VTLQAELESFRHRQEHWPAAVQGETDPLQFGPDIVIVPPPPLTREDMDHIEEDGGGDELMASDDDGVRARRRRSRAPLALAADDAAVDGGFRSADDDVGRLAVYSNPMLRSSTNGRGAFSGSNRRIAANPMSRHTGGLESDWEPTLGQSADDDDGDIEDELGGGHEMYRNPLHYGPSARLALSPPVSSVRSTAGPFSSSGRTSPSTPASPPTASRIGRSTVGALRRGGSNVRPEPTEAATAASIDGSDVLVYMESPMRLQNAS